jgi:hypothetical protein
VRLNFLTTAELDLNNTEKVARALVDVVGHRMPQPNGERKITRGSGTFSLPEAVSGLRITRRPWISTAEWIPPLGAFVPEIPSPMIWDRVEEKNCKYEGYEKLSQMWLVMVFNQPPLPNSAWFSVPDSTTVAPSDTKFDRVFLLDVSAGRAYRLSNLFDPSDERPS